MQVLGFEEQLDAVRHRNACGEKEYRGQVVHALVPVTLREIDTQKQHVSRLGVGKDVPSDQIGVGIHNSTGKR